MSEQNNNVFETLKSVGEKMPRVYGSGFEQGRVAEYNEFWDEITDNGNRNSYQCAFRCWGSEYLRPNIKITPSKSDSANQTFYECKKLKKIEAACFDFSNKTKGTNTQTGYYFTFYGCSELQEIEDVGLQADYGYSEAFSSNPKLHTIAKIRCDENTKFSGAFNFTYALQNVSFDGVIGQDISFSESRKLSADSIRNIFEHLSDTASGKTITLSSTAKAKSFTDEEWATLIATRSNWTITLI